MKKLWEDNAWNEYLEWQTKDKKTCELLGNKLPSFLLQPPLLG